MGNIRSWGVMHVIVEKMECVVVTHFAISIMKDLRIENIEILIDP